MITNLDNIADMVHQNAVEKGFHDPEETELAFMANQCNNIHAEVTELWDAYRAGIEGDFCDKAVKMIELNLQPLTQKEEELADIIIRALDVSRHLRIDIVGAINAKHAYNKTRPHKHGKKN